MVLHNVMLLVVGLLISILLQGSTPALILSKPYTVIVVLVPTVTITLHACVYCYRFVCSYMYMNVILFVIIKMFNQSTYLKLCITSLCSSNLLIPSHNTTYFTTIISYDFITNWRSWCVFWLIIHSLDFFVSLVHWFCKYHFGSEMP